MRTQLAWLFVFAAVTVGDAATADRRLIDAVRAGDRGVLQALLGQGVDVNGAEADETTALHWAVRANDAETARLLMRAGAAVNAKNRYGVTPLLLAATNADAAMVEALLDAGANPNAALPDGQTVVMTAARTGSAAAVGVLLARGADPNAREDRLGETPLTWAAAEDQAGAIAILIEYGADVNARSDRMTFPRFSFGDGIVALMMTLPRGDWTPLMYAARQGALEATRALLAGHADPDLTDPEGTTALMLAINNAHYDVAALLIEQGADPNVGDVTGMTALYAAVDMSTLGALPGRPAPVPTGPLRAIDVVQMLLTRGADPNARLSAPILQRHHSGGDRALGEGATSLLRAAKVADLPVIRLLLDNGADPAATTATGTSAVMFAAGQAGGGLGGTFEVSDADKVAAIELFLDRGVDVNAGDANGQTALHVAAAQAGEEVVAALARRGARLDLQDKRGRTALEVAQGVGGRGAQPVVRTAIVDVLRRFADHVDGAAVR
jgi:ankyrin repeat protein